MINRPWLTDGEYLYGEKRILVLNYDERSWKVSKYLLINLLRAIARFQLYKVVAENIALFPIFSWLML